MQDGALQLTESLSCETHELVKFDISCCGLSPNYFSQFSTNGLLGGILELNLGGNSITQEVNYLLIRSSHGGSSVHCLSSY